MTNRPNLTYKEKDSNNIMTEKEIMKYWDKLKNETYTALGHKPLPVLDSINMTLENITKESTYKLNEIALFEFENYFAKAVKYKDFNFIIVPINDKYQYTAEQYLALLENYHNHIEKLKEGLEEFKKYTGSKENHQ